MIVHVFEQRGPWAEHMMYLWRRGFEGFNPGFYSLRDPHDIVMFLSAFIAKSPTGIVFFEPGTMDLIDIRLSSQPGCIELGSSVPYIIMPKCLHVVAHPDHDPVWWSMHLETQSLEPCLRTVPDRVDERCLELAPGEYVDDDLRFEPGHLGFDENGFAIPFPPESRIISRYLAQGHVMNIVCKGGPHNLFRIADGMSTNAWDQHALIDYIEQKHDAYLPAMTEVANRWFEMVRSNLHNRRDSFVAFELIAIVAQASGRGDTSIRDYATSILNKNDVLRRVLRTFHRDAEILEVFPELVLSDSGYRSPLRGRQAWSTQPGPLSFETTYADLERMLDQPMNQWGGLEREAYGSQRIQLKRNDVDERIWSASAVCEDTNWTNPLRGVTFKTTDFVRLEREFYGLLWETEELDEGGT